jgi:hypothetical protein
MANTNSDVTFRGHAEIIVRKLQQKPMTAQQILKATNGTTPHNSWSLARIAERHGGLVLRTIDGSENRDGLKRYAFDPKPVAKKPAKKTAAAAMTVKKPAKKTSR